MAPSTRAQKRTACKKSEDRGAGSDDDYAPSTPSTPEPFPKPRIYKSVADPSWRPKRHPSTPSTPGFAPDSDKVRTRRSTKHKVGKKSTRKEKKTKSVHFQDKGAIARIGSLPARVMTNKQQHEEPVLRLRLIGHDDRVPSTAVLSQAPLSYEQDLLTEAEQLRVRQQAETRKAMELASRYMSPPPTPMSQAHGRKRLAEDPSKSPSKKVRATASSPVVALNATTAIPFIDISEKIVPKLSNTKATEKAFPINPAQAMIAELENEPTVLSLAEISALFYHLQDRIQAFVESYFEFDLSQEAREAWPLHQLSTTYRPLMLVTQFIADGSQYGWRQFFTESDQRVALVYGIIGEWFKERIFNHTAFGLTEDELNELEHIDREYIHFDAFVRNKHRAALLSELLYRRKSTVQRSMDIHAVASELAEELITALTPVLPPSIFKYCRQGNKFFDASANDTTASIARNALVADLIRLIKAATALHLSIRLTGRDGTLVRIAPQVSKGSVFHPTAPMNCINPDFCDRTQQDFEFRDHPANTPPFLNKNPKLRIKMTCFGRVEAVVPHGPDYETLIVEQEKWLADQRQPRAVAAPGGDSSHGSGSSSSWSGFPSSSSSSSNNTTPTTCNLSSSSSISSSTTSSTETSSEKSPSSPSSAKTPPPRRSPITADDFTFAELEDYLWPTLPQELQNRERVRYQLPHHDSDPEPFSVSGDSDSDNDTINTRHRTRRRARCGAARLARAAHGRRTTTTNNNENSEDNNHGNEENNGSPQRGAYVTLYPRLCSMDVYCEWTPEPESDSASNAALLTTNTAMPLPPAATPENRTLRYAVMLARRERGTLALKLEDIAIDTWNGFVRHEAVIEWAAFAAILLAGAGWKWSGLIGRIVRGVVGTVKSVTKKNNGAVSLDMKEIQARAKEVIGKVLWRVGGGFGRAEYHLKKILDMVRNHTATVLVDANEKSSSAAAQVLTVSERTFAENYAALCAHLDVECRQDIDPFARKQGAPITPEDPFGEKIMRVTLR